MELWNVESVGGTKLTCLELVFKHFENVISRFIPVGGFLGKIPSSEYSITSHESCREFQTFVPVVKDLLARHIPSDTNSRHTGLPPIDFVDEIGHFLSILFKVALSEACEFIISVLRNLHAFLEVSTSALDKLSSNNYLSSGKGVEGLLP